MRRQLVSVTFAAIVIMAAAVGASPTLTDDPVSTGAPTMAVQQVTIPGPVLRDELAMVLVGTALIGLAAAVRRAA